MGSMKADLDALGALSKTLHDIADKAAVEKVGPTAGPYASTPGGMLPSLLAASDVCKNLIEGDLVPAVKERLKTTGDVMADIAKAYQGQDDGSAEQMLNAYKNAVGNWGGGIQ